MSMRAAPALAAALVVAALAARAGEDAPPVRAPAPASAGEIDATPTLPSPAARLEEIRARVQRAVVYPARARERGLEGVARIQFRIAPDGRAAEVSVLASSGSGLLDAAAEQSAHDAGRLPPLYGWVRIPVRFALR